MSAKSSALLESFGIVAETRIIALVGAGGKTALLYALARELQRKGRTVVTTTTTKIFPPTRSQSPCLILLTDDPALRTLPAQLLDVGHVTVGRSILFPVMKVEGVEEPIIELCKKAADHVLVEADGAAGRPIKAPEEWEPVIPRGTDLVIHLVGLDCLGKPVADDWVFRPARFAEITKLQGGRIIDPHAIGSLVAHPQGGLKHVPEQARIVPFLNKQDLVFSDQAIEETVKEIMRRAGGRMGQVVVGSVTRGLFAVYR